MAFWIHLSSLFHSFVILTLNQAQLPSVLDPIGYTEGSNGADGVKSEPIVAIVGIFFCQNKNTAKDIRNMSTFGGGTIYSIFTGEYR